MHINNVALWVKNLEKSKEFYTKYFTVKASELYVNTKTGFCSYFLTFKNGSKIELKVTSKNSTKEYEKIK